MKKIYKYEIASYDSQIIETYKNAIPLCVQVQNNKPCVWFEVETDNTQVEILIEVFGTGHDMPTIGVSKRQYIGTYQLLGGTFVGHVYYRTSGN